MSLAADVLLRRGLGSVLLLLLAAPALASEPWRAVARVASPEDAALLERVRGQSSDLPVLLVAEVGTPLDGPSALRWSAAERLAEEHQARAVLWFLREGSNVHVQVAEPASRHLFVRSARLMGAPGSLEWSAGAEALALTVRSALRAVDLGEPLGDVVEPPVVSAPAPAPAPEPVLAPAPVQSMAAPLPAASSSRWRFSVGGYAALDGYGQGGHQGLSLGAGWERDSWQPGFELRMGMPTRLLDEYTRLTLRQYAAVLRLERPFVSIDSLSCTYGLEAGAVVFTRRTEALAPQVEAAPASTIVSPLVGLRGAARWSPAARFALELSLAAEVLMGRPELGYAVDGNVVPRGDGAPIRPRAGLAMVFLL
ncbi:hypothetical protein JY651_22065 [Pyxidicoccus parkwayensis]|uniref:Uncharacterized protein n=1 Tax=Pyxidicoccus parkwayensis TaxID=2813578 RepID=A0ABX7PAD5_9BACT|nr:hypothetical protein [Pyxidicoccus parkwaysis]QSQ27431.1 hypothetical protein JY651_22065 [Pyxidicoccus parkwaysis]